MVAEKLKYRRYFKFMLQWLFLEKLRDLDFTMRDISFLESSGGLHGYSKTDKAHAKAIFDSLFVNESKKLLDVGCGKGAFVRGACKEPFGAVAGIEYVERLAGITKRNFKRLADYVKVYTGDATAFKHYGDYNIFYFFNRLIRLLWKR